MLKTADTVWDEGNAPIPLSFPKFPPHSFLAKAYFLNNYFHGEAQVTQAGIVALQTRSQVPLEDMIRRSLKQAAHSPELLLLIASFSFLGAVDGSINPTLAKRGLASIFGHQSPSPNAANSSLPAPTTPSGPSTPCVQPALNNATWIQLGIDNYLANLPNGTSMNLQHYAASVGGNDFICGIGEKCHAGQLCSPVQSPGWEVLLATQEWNNFQNKFYEAVGIATQLVSTISGSLVVDLYPPAHTGGSWDLFASFSLAAGITAAIAGAAFFFLSTAAIVASPLSLLLLPAIAVTSGVTGGIGLQEALKDAPPNALDRYAVYAFYLAEWQKHVQKSIANNTKSIINSGVSSPQGISSVLKNGTFFVQRPVVSESEMIASLRNTTTVRVLTDILRNQRAFVTINSDKCTYKGPGGAWKGDDVLSYCSPNGTMFNIIHSSHKKVHNKWYNAQLIKKKYDITVKYLAEQSYFCQLNHGTSNFDPYKSGEFPTSLDAECIANLPVCDFRIPELADAKHEKNTLYACRGVGKLPI